MMDWSTITTTVITTVGVIAVAGFGYLGVRYTGRASGKANAEDLAAEQQANAEAAEQERFKQAWPELLDNIRTEFVEPLRAELRHEREARQELAKKVDDQGREIRSLSSEVHRWQQIARTLARWGLRLRDQVIALGGTVPSDPHELISLRAIEEAQLDREQL